MKGKRHWIIINFPLVIIIVYIIISIILISLNIKDNNLVFINIVDFATYKITYSEDVLSMLSLNITIVTTLVGLSIAVATFLLGRTNIKLADYLYLVANKDHCLLIILITLINAFLSLFVIYQPYTIILDIWLKIGIIPSIVLFIVLIKNFEVIDKEEEMKKYLLLLLNKKDKNFVDFAIKITNNNFNTEFYDILYYVMENTEIIDKEYLFLINQTIINKKKGESIDYLFKMQLFALPTPDEKLFDELQNKYLDMAFKQYKKLIFDSHIVYNNFILNIKTNLYFHILHNEKLNIDQEERLLKKYLNLMFRSYELVIIVLNKGNIRDARSAINDFIGLVQFFSVNKMVNRNNIKINETYDNYLMGIICWILDFIIIKDLQIDHIDIIKTLLNRINEIDLLSIETDMFEEIVTDITFHKVRYTRTFFLALSLLFINDSEIYETLEKIKIDKKHYNNQFLYQDIIDVYNDVTIQEKKAINMPNEMFAQKKDSIINIIKSKIINITSQQTQSITNAKIKSEILESVRLDIENELTEFMLPDDTDRNEKSETVRKNIIFESMIPRRYLIGDSSSIFVGMNVYKTSILLYFYKNYVENCEKSSILKISNIKENATIIMPIYLNDYIFQHDEYNYKGDGIEIENKYYKVLWIQTRGPIVILDDLLKFLHLPKDAVKITAGQDTIENGEVYTKCSIEIEYIKDLSINPIGYSII